MVGGITRDDAASGEFDDVLTMKQVRADIIYNFPCYTVCWIAGASLEVGMIGEKPVISNKASEIYGWMGY